MPVPALPFSPMLARRLCGRPMLLLLDVDGTLAPIAPRPEYATVPPATQQLLEQLVALPYVHVAVITGRSAEDARRLVGVGGVWVIGNHGFEIAKPNEAAAPDERVTAFTAHVAEAVERCRAAAALDPGVIVEDKRWTLSVHYRLAHPRIVPELTAAVEAIGRDLDLRVTRGKEVLELRPPVDIDKGTAGKALAESLGALRESASLLCAGDDRTDEDAFRALRAAQPACVTVRVGSDTTAETAAEFVVGDTEAMRALLEAVLAIRSAGR